MAQSVNLNIRRSDKAGDSRLASVEDRLEQALEDSRTRKWTKCLLIFYEEEDDEYYTSIRYAGCTNLEARGLLLTELRREILEP